MMKNKNELFFILLIIVCAVFFISGCYVVAKVNIHASDLEYPVSYTDSFYDDQFKTTYPGTYTIIEEFSIEFTKWSLSFPINTESDEDISKKLNEIIKKNNGDGIVELKITVSDSPINSLTLFTKIVSFWGLIAGTASLLADGTKDAAILAGCSLAIYLLSPAAANINIEGKVVKIDHP
ncbi:MAG: hypothetical protein KAV45_12935 [Calditrichia bacterium]|nr:hypothetical protein [Calditrichia bacterium]